MKNLLIEIGTEEIPDSYLSKARQDFENAIVQSLKSQNLTFTSSKSFATPRRLAVVVNDLPEKQPDVEVVKRGPTKKISYDENGNPTKALLGFAKANGVSVDEIIFEFQNGVEYAFVRKTVKGKATQEVLKDIIPDAVKSLKFPKAMRWGKGKFAFVRPIRWITAVFGNDTIEFEIAGVKSGNTTRGHRFLSKGELKVNAETYEKTLELNRVYPSPERRKHLITEGIKVVENSLKAKAVLPEELLETIVNLTEFPVVQTAEFSSDFLELPEEVLMSEMIDHQKYIPLKSTETGKLINKFIVVLNTEPSKEIIKGNEKVIKARFNDGRFFYQEDKKRPLEWFVEKLKGMNFIAGLGSMYDKTMRIKTLAGVIADMINPDVKETAERSAYLSKADLSTQMVYEFPELQGIMGYYYAIESGEKEEVAIAIKEHYLPRFSGDDLPESPAGKVVSLADKLDNLFSLYSAGKKVTGSKDPYGLRRQVLGITRILVEKKIHLDISNLLESVKSVYIPLLTLDWQEFMDSVMSFFRERVRSVFKEYGFRTDEINAMLSGDFSDIYDAYLRVEALHEIREKSPADFESVSTAFKRLINITEGIDGIPEEVDKELLTEPAEKELWNFYISEKPAVESETDKGNYKAVMNELIKFRPIVDRFFDEVLVMCEDEKTRLNRLALCKKVAEPFQRIIDFRKIEVSK